MFDVKKEAAALSAELETIYKDLHRHPEIGYDEHRTSGIIADYLRACGMEVQTGIAITGVVGTLDSGRPGKTLLIRADMDCLQVEEMTACDYRSENPGKMHACGHDAHVTMLLGAAKLLSAHRDAFRGKIKFLFEPSEESIPASMKETVRAAGYDGEGGAGFMIQQGVLEGVDMALALHVQPVVPAGKIQIARHEATASSDVYDIMLTGKGGHGAMPDRGAADRETESLSAFLCDQLERRRLPKPLLALTRYLAELVDEEGRLSQEDLDGVADLKIPQALTQQALETLQSLDPAGVGARSLSECLLLQLARQDAPSPLDMEIVRRFLPDLGKKHYSLIARELHTTPEEVRAAEKRISALDPCPGRSFQPAEPTLYVRPDLFIAELDGKLQVILNDYYLPRVSISQYYVRLLKESDEPETRAYLQQKMQQAKWLLNSLERRGSTLRQCAEAILETQRAFFAGQTTELVPMTMVTLAERLHLHPSTVSRATREKYLQCRQGTYPLRYFFSRALGEQGPSQQTVKLRLLELIRQEDHSRPLSDQKLAELLAEQGIRIARRTVAKYRTELRLGSAAARKRD